MTRPPKLSAKARARRTYQLAAAHWLLEAIKQTKKPQRRLRVLGALIRKLERPLR